jgi:hypothetical protein
LTPAAPTVSFAPIQQVASILHLPVTDALIRLVTEYAALGSLPLLGEADAAREWIDDPARNPRHSAMTVAFFRRWLKREWERRERCSSLQRPASSPTEAPVGSRSRSAAPSLSETGRLPNLMHLAEEDRQVRERVS